MFNLILRMNVFAFILKVTKAKCVSLMYEIKKKI